MKKRITVYLPLFCGLLLLAACNKDDHPLINPNTNDGLCYTFITPTDSVLVVKLGEQVWMQQDIAGEKSTSSLNYHEEPVPVPEYTYADQQKKRAMCHSSQLGNTGYYNYMFNWFAFMEQDTAQALPRGICPKGFHIPSSKDWNQLEKYLWRKNRYYIKKSGSVANALAVDSNYPDDWGDVTDWEEFAWPINAYMGTPGCRLDTNNSTHFRAIPGGTVGVVGETSIRSGVGMCAVYATSSTPDVSSGYNDMYCTRIIYYNDPKLHRSEMDKRRFAQVRCIKDDNVINPKQ